jgi:hypothetical protein
MLSPMETYCRFAVVLVAVVGSIASQAACGASNQTVNDQTTVTVEKPSGSAAASSAPSPPSQAPSAPAK